MSTQSSQLQSLGACVTRRMRTKQLERRRLNARRASGPSKRSHSETRWLTFVKNAKQRLVFCANQVIARALIHARHLNTKHVNGAEGSQISTAFVLI